MSMKKTTLSSAAACVAFLALVSGRVCRAQPAVADRPRATAAAEPQAAEVLAADDERIAATTTRDTAALRRILDDDLRYVHADGVVDSKESFIGLVESGRTRYVSFEPVDRIVLFPTDDVAVVSGRADLVIAQEGKRIAVTLSFQGVWRRVLGAWRFMAWQSSRIPAANPGR